MGSAVVEGHPGSCDQVPHRLGHEHLRRRGKGGDAGTDVDGQAAGLPVDELALPGVDAGSNGEAEWTGRR